MYKFVRFRSGVSNPVNYEYTRLYWAHLNLNIIFIFLRSCSIQHTETMRYETIMRKRPIRCRSLSNRLQKHTRPVTDMLNFHTNTNTWPRGVLKEPRTLNLQQLQYRSLHDQTNQVKLTLHNSCWMILTSRNVPSETKLSRIYNPTTAAAGLADILKDYCVQCWISAA